MIIKSVLIEEQRRLERALKAYENEIDHLPKGSIQLKLINGKNYAYRAWRSGSRVATERIKDSMLEEMRKNINRRQRLEKQVREIKRELKYLEKVIK